MKKFKKSKKAVGALTALLMAGMLAGCGAKENNARGDSAGENTANENNTVSEAQGQEEQAQKVLLKDVEVEKYVTLGEYKGLKTMVNAPEVDLAQKDELVKSVYYDALKYATGVVIEDGITNRAVENGDIVNIDYEGKRDGVAFGGGTAEAAYLAIGSGQFIDGFEEGLVGVMPGDTVDLSLTFPATYQNTELAGQEVIFTVTVNYIMPEGMHEAIISIIGIDGVVTEEDLEQYVHDYLLASAEENYKVQMQNAVLELLVENCTFKELPEPLVQQYENLFRENIEMNAMSAGMDADSFLVTYYNYAGGLDAFINEYADKAVEQDLALQAVANQENLSVSDEELNTVLMEQATMYGFQTVEEYLGDVPLEECRTELLLNKAMDFLIENADTGN